MTPGKRYTVFSIRKKDQGPVIWVRAGVAFVNPDDSMNLYLDVLPIEGQLHIRESAEKRAMPSTGRFNPRPQYPMQAQPPPPPQHLEPQQPQPQSNSNQDAEQPESWSAQQALGGH